LLAVPAILSLGLLWPRLIIRPELISFLGFVLAVRWVENALRPPPSPSDPLGTASPGSSSRWRNWLALVVPWSAAGRLVWLAWLWAQGKKLGVEVVPIPGTTKVRNLESNCRAVDVPISDAELVELSGVFDSVVGERGFEQYMDSTYRVRKDAR